VESEEEVDNCVDLKLRQTIGVTKKQDLVKLYEGD
jgi:hypothetical protein